MIHASHVTPTNKAIATVVPALNQPCCAILLAPDVGDEPDDDAVAVVVSPEALEDESAEMDVPEVDFELCLVVVEAASAAVVLLTAVTVTSDVPVAVGWPAISLPETDVSTQYAVGHSVQSRGIEIWHA
ncbi:hypothetical protein M406DRAFT_72955 [Cryphonectria parasitica EP155]|uniref:Uncharacterized protein n=1 Tax=Cryphonectria parasitica (strain ATCC 38755 / EP155) TaxID=660469 RepID=A0A9P4XT73_CRYP1|nr:uncharacterized protein M406DRAFT_72955 [Cryphonectria parasitica EP155]KAF3760463.1 hypothetical protein M406DRAFT_72955 [Cryphonectria parasitica EP155]